MSCSSRHRLPDDWVRIVTSKVNIGDPIWANYNSDRMYYEKLKFVSDDQIGILCRSDLPAQPDPDDYTDLDSPADVSDFNYSGMNRPL